MLALDVGALLIFGLRGHLFRSEDRGASWRQPPTGTTATLLTGVGARRRSDRRDTAALVEPIPIFFWRSAKAASVKSPPTASERQPNCWSKIDRLLLRLFAVVTALLGQQATRLRIDATRASLIFKPSSSNRDPFGGADRILIAVRAKDGDIFAPNFFETLQQVTDAGSSCRTLIVARCARCLLPMSVSSRSSRPGFAGGTVIPSDFRADPGRVRAGSRERSQGRPGPSPSRLRK